MPKRTDGRFNVLWCGAALLIVSLLLPRTLFAAPIMNGQVPIQLPPPAVPAPSAATPSLTQGVWLWVRTQYSDDSVVQSRNPNQYTLAFMDDGRVAIRADCNTGSATYTTDGTGGLTIQPGIMTLAACPPGSQDTVFLRDLMQTATYVFDGPQLVLNMRLDSGNMYFSPQSPTALVGPTWRVTGINNGMQAVVSTVSGTQVSMQFADDGRVSGDTGCNLYNGAYTLSGASITFGPMATTRRACASDDANAQEQQFLTALGNITTYELNGDRLTFRDSAGAMQVTAVRPTVQPPRP